MPRSVYIHIVGFKAAKRVDALGGGKRTDDLLALKQAMGVSQHHDAITGTEKQAVNSDYQLRLEYAEI